jgi:hypothetical protein
VVNWCTIFFKSLVEFSEFLGLNFYFVEKKFIAVSISLLRIDLFVFLILLFIFVGHIF